MAFQNFQWFEREIKWHAVDEAVKLVGLDVLLKGLKLINDIWNFFLTYCKYKSENSKNYIYMYTIHV